MESAYEQPSLSSDMDQPSLDQVRNDAATAGRAAQKDYEQKGLSPVMQDLGWTESETATSEPPTPPKAPVKRSRSQIARDAIGPRYGEEEGVGMPDGKPIYYQPYQPLTPEEQAERQAVLNGTGHRQAKVAATIAEMGAVSRAAGGNISLQLAIARARAEKRGRQ